jgi:hypothetical protein
MSKIKPNAPSLKKIPTGSAGVAVAQSFQRIAGLERGKEKWGGPVSDCFCAYAHRTNRGIFFCERNFLTSVEDFIKNLRVF